MKHFTIRWKLTLWYAVVLAAVLTTFSGVVYFVMRHQLLGRIDQGLGEELADVLSEVERAQNSAGMLEWLNRRFAHHEGFDFEITDTGGRRVFVNPRLAEQALTFVEALPPARSLGYETLEVASAGRWRIISTGVSGPDGPLTVRVGRSLASFEHEMRELLLTFLLTGPLTLLAAVGGGYVLACRALRPVQSMTQTANRITADRLHERIEAGNPDDELGTLAATLNHMIERLERSFPEMRRFTADAAHELRTPLAVMRSEAEVALRSSRSPEEYSRVLENLLEETNRLATLADQLLFLCRQDAGLQPAGNEAVQMSELLGDVVSNMQLLADEQNVRLIHQEIPDCWVSSDGRQLRRVFYNLLDNAIKYTPAGGTVSVTSRSENGRFSATVADTGIGIPAEHLPHIFDRFYRVDSSRSRAVSRADGFQGRAIGLAGGRGEDDPRKEPQNGSGLGLSICQSIVRGLGGEILAESHPGEGTCVTIFLPTQPSVRNSHQERSIV